MLLYRRELKFIKYIFIKKKTILGNLAMVILLIFSNKNCMFFWQFTIFIYLFKNYMGSSYLSLAFPNRVQPNATHFINNLKKIHKT